MIKIIPLLLFILLIPSDVPHSVRSIDPDFDRCDRGFMSAVQTFIIVELATNEVTDDLLSVKIINQLGRPAIDIYHFIYNETGGNVPNLLKDYYPCSNGIDAGIIITDA